MVVAAGERERRRKGVTVSFRHCLRRERGSRSLQGSAVACSPPPQLPCLLFSFRFSILFPSFIRIVNDWERTERIFVCPVDSLSQKWRGGEGRGSFSLAAPPNSAPLSLSPLFSEAILSSTSAASTAIVPGSHGHPHRRFSRESSPGQRCCHPSDPGFRLALLPFGLFESRCRHAHLSVPSAAAAAAAASWPSRARERCWRTWSGKQPLLE